MTKLGAGDPGRAYQLFSGGIGLHHRVFLDGAVKEQRVLGHHTDPRRREQSSTLLMSSPSILMRPDSGA